MTYELLIYLAERARRENKKTITISHEDWLDVYPGSDTGQREFFWPHLKILVLIREEY